MKLSDILGICEIEKQAGVCVWGIDGYKEVLGNDYVCLVCEKDRRIVGFIVGRVLSEEAEILNLAVVSEWQGYGIGGQLVETYKEFAKIKGARKIWLEVRESNLKARRFYEKHGFTKVFERKNFYRDPEEDALVMMCRI